MSKNLFLAVLNRSTMEKALSRCTCAPVLNTAWLRSSPSHATLTAVAHLQGRGRGSGQMKETQTTTSGVAHLQQVGNRDA